MDTSGSQLVRELLESSYLIPSYSNHLIKKVNLQIKKEKKDLDEIITNEDYDSPSLSATILYHHFSIRRSKRCLCVYHNERLKTIKRLRWTHGSTLPSEISENCLQEERNFFQEYSLLLMKYMSQIRLDLYQNMNPPCSKNIYIHVLVVNDIGEILTNFETQTIRLLKGSKHYVRYNDVKKFLKNGDVIQITNPKENVQTMTPTKNQKNK
ncbi:partner of sld5 [Anaeramoeba flamelloides]|uniref:Partner of sld5 n=1 Tax=Anaeramoeba flamelloides TaxID=1746091 RepID=A0AAV8A7S2_9EUKA|nr:partner of sld5 [Anaeramoeba flamelloides]